ncbi:putative RNA uridine N3 methyltransferase [Sulfuracidifex metallicus]|uniref:putative RNA uridine N3 methyltransferase n=1 Tax=Sulfuracidifex metallicus TaxID=47303 RepID=UPI002274F1EA|nr:putative RNA uridine N3 methyltransferase [Sulfuracidifex metallicus]MCY0849208.1 hypothetical protein [Sulfuracidifex metallicus]
MIFVPRRKPLNLVLFLSLFDKRDLRYITEKFSFIMRVSSIFRVNDLIWIDDVKNKDINKIICELYKYSILPSYLKKDFPIKNELKYAGLLSPVNLPSHPQQALPLEGEVRIGRKGNFGIDVDIPCNDGYSMVIDSIKRRAISYPDFTLYSGATQKIIDEEGFCSAISPFTIVGTRSGNNPLERYFEIKNNYERFGITLIIGPPKGGIIRKVSSCNGNEKKEQYNKIEFYNFIPKQGVRDVRAEEALLSSLSIINMIIN